MLYPSLTGGRPCRELLRTAKSLPPKRDPRHTPNFPSHVPFLRGSILLLNHYPSPMSGPEPTAADDFLRALAERTLDVYWAADDRGILTYVAPQVRRITGRDPEDLIGSHVHASVLEDDALEAAALERALLDHKENCIVAYRLARADGDPVWVEASMHAVRSPDGALTGFVGTWHDITEKRRVEIAYEHQAYHDALTGLPNRRLFEDRLTIALAAARRYRTQLALLYIDIDRLSRINDTLGHAAGDEVLREVGRRLDETVRASDTFARHGADDFVLLVTNLRHEEDCVRVAQLLLNKMREPLIVKGRELFVTASIGVAVFPQDGTEVSTLLASADAAAHTCKTLGGNGWYLHNSAINKRGVQRLSMEMDLYRAIERSQFFIQYQPLLALTKQRLTAVEALVRWKHPTHGELPPATFLDVAEETGLIIGIGERVIESSCSQAHTWRAEGWKDATISVNLSARQFEHPDLLDMIDDSVRKYAVPPSVLQLEITEGTALRDLRRSVDILAELRDRGVGVTIDDFGIGYSSLAYLKELPVIGLKIDRTFLLGIPEARDAAIVSSVIAMGHALGLTVVAEGVETEEQARFLREQGCDLCQGYLFGRPTSADEISRIRLQ